MYFRWSLSYFGLQRLKRCIEISQTKLSVMQILNTSMQSSRCHQILQTYKRWHLPHETIFFLFQNVVPWQHWLRAPSFSLNIDILHFLFYSKQIYKKTPKTKQQTTNKKEERFLWYLYLTSKESLHSYWAQNILRNQMLLPACKLRLGHNSFESQSTEICCSSQKAAASSVNT